MRPFFRDTLGVPCKLRNCTGYGVSYFRMGIAKHVMASGIFFICIK